MDTHAPPGWSVVDGKKLERTYRFDDWKGAFSFVARISDIAEAMNHHPDVELGWGRVVVHISTHDGPVRLTAKDTELASRIDGIPPPYRL